MGATGAALVMDAAEAATPEDGPAIVVDTHAVGVEDVPAEVAHAAVHGAVYVTESDAVAYVTAVSDIVAVVSAEDVAAGAENVDVTVE